MFTETKLFICVLIVSTLPVIIFQDIYYKNYYNQFYLVLLPLLWPGLAHGSLDLKIAKRLKFINNKKTLLLFFFVYIFLAFITILFWLFSPNLFILCFLTISIFHFGLSDSIILINRKIEKIEILIRGLIPIVFPIYFYAPEITFIFSVLRVDESFTQKINLINTQLFYGLLLITLFSFYKYYKTKISKKFFFNYFYEILFIMFCFTFFEPLISFSIYFCFLHSLRHLFFEKNILKLNYIDLFKETLPITLFTIILIMLFYFIVLKTTFDYSFLPLIFVSLASLTVPHMILVSFSK